MLAEAIAAALPELRAAAKARMTSTVVIRRLTGKQIQDETTGLQVPEWAIVYTGPFRLAGGSSGDGGSRTVSVAGVTYEQATALGHFPHDTYDLADNDLIDVTAGEWAGSVWQIVEATKADQKTARRVPVVEVARPEEWA